MTRKEYIEKLDEVRDALLHIGADFKSSTITDENEIEEARRMTAGKLFDKLDTLLFENGAVSMRIREENLVNGIGEQGDLFEAHPDGEVDDGDDLPPPNFVTSFDATDEDLNTTENLHAEIEAAQADIEARQAKKSRKAKGVK